jgi:hypothetical protein
MCYKESKVQSKIKTMQKKTVFMKDFLAMSECLESIFFLLYVATEQSHP